MPPGFRPRLSSLLLAASLAALTCDDARRSDSLAEDLARAFCAHRFACCSPFEISAISTDRYKNEADCVEFATLAARQQLGTVEGAIAQGRITVDDARAEACFRAYRNQACAAAGNTFIGIFPQQQISPLPDAAGMLAGCADMLVGHVPNDRACNLSQECLSGSHCLSGTTPTVPGPIMGEGGAAGTVVATPGICVRYQQAGERCNQAADCDPTHFSCRQPEFTCGPKPQEGQPCLAELDPFTGYPRNTCDESRGLYCDLFSNTCRHYPRDGELCNQTGLPQCDPDPMLALSCNQITITCRRAGKEGDACGATAAALQPCWSDLACHPTQADGIGICGSIPTQGQPCVDRCVSPAVCSDGTCLAAGAVPIGSPCTTNADCTSLSCNSFQGGKRVCGVQPYLFAQCMGADVTPGRVTGAGGIGGTFGTAGSIGTGTSTGTGTGVGAKGMPPTGAGGMGGIGPAIGCQFSNLPPNDPIIADFNIAMGDTPVIPIGGTFTYGSPSPTATASAGAWHVTLDAPGTDIAQYLGVGIFFNGDPSGLACIDATAHTGVQFDISGSVGGVGCTAQYATNDSFHTETTADPKGAGPPGSYAPQAALTVSATPTTVMMPFTGTGAPTGGSPAIAVDRARLTGVLWQFSVAAGTSNRCIVDVTIDNVRFF